MDRQSSQARTERAWKLRLRGRSWPEIAEAEGFRTPRSARAAVRKWLERNPPDELALMRRAAGDTLAVIIDRVLDSLDAAQAKGDHRGVAQLAQVALDGVGRKIQLEGLAIPVAQQVEVTVNQSPTEVIAATRERLLALLPKPAAVIDAEVVALPVEAPQ